MSGRHSRARTERGQQVGPSGRRAAVVAGGGVAGLVSIVAVAAPLMDAGPAGAAEATAAAVVTTSAPQTSPVPTHTRTSAPESSTSTTEAPSTNEAPSTTEAPSTEPETSTSTTTPTTTPTTEAPSTGPVSSTTEPVAPDYGFQKYRVGVRPRSDAYIPDGITTAGSVLHVTESGSDGTTVDQFDCTTTADVSADGTTYCDPSANDDQLRLHRLQVRRERAVHPAVVTGPPANSFDNRNAYFATTAGSTITVTQTAAPDGLVADPEKAELPPCEPGSFGDECDQTDVIFEDTGLPPKATDDSATTPMNTPVTIDVGANDSTYSGASKTYDAPVTDETIAAEPHDGTVQVAPLTGGDPDTGRAAARVAAAAVPAPPKITYTPNAGFHGVDTFKYTLRTRNGASTATVTVTVPGPAGSTSPATTAGTDPTSATRTSFAVDPTSDTRSPAAATSSSGGLASTGTPASGLLGYGAALFVAGAGAVAVGRHRRPRTGRHGRTH